MQSAGGRLGEARRRRWGNEGRDGRCRGILPRTSGAEGGIWARARVIMKVGAGARDGWGEIAAGRRLWRGECGRES